MATNAEENRRGWAAVLCRSGVADVFGAARRSPRLHWTKRAAQEEAQGWIEDLRIGPMTWEVVDDDLLTVGRSRSYAAILYSILLPRGDGAVSK
jgi:hypothetical protein